MYKAFDGRLLVRNAQVKFPDKDDGSESLVNIAARMIARSVQAQKYDSPNPCECGKIVEEINTHSEIYGDISCFPMLCNACRKYYWEKERLERKKSAYFSSAKCGEKQNKNTLHSGKIPRWADVTGGYPKQKQYIDYIESVINGNNKGAFVYGPTGTGKTFLAKVLNNELTEQLRETCFIKAVDWVLLLRKSAFDNLGRDLIREFREVETLIIDDYGTQKDTEWVKEVMFSILDYRYENQKQTIITTNMTLDDISDFNQRLSSRFSDPKWLSQILLAGQDLRLD